MRSGDFAVEVVPSDHARVRELDSGHVLARPGTVYHLRLRNFGPLYCVADISIDGRRVTAGGLVLRPWSTTDLERPVDEGEDGRFTVAAEGDESAFGPDGGRDNDALGLIDARFRRELPGGPRVARTCRRISHAEPVADAPPAAIAVRDHPVHDRLRSSRRDSPSRRRVDRRTSVRTSRRHRTHRTFRSAVHARWRSVRWRRKRR